MSDMPHLLLLAALGVSVVLFTTSCGKSDHAHEHGPAADAPARHEHHARHGGTPVVLGEEAYHLELVLDRARGVLQAFVLDGEMENFIRSAAPSFEVVATVSGETRTLAFKPVANPATGEKSGDTALFEAEADWLKTARDFDAVLTSLNIHGTVFVAVTFNFPKGNEAHGREARAH